MGDFEDTFGTGVDAVDIIEGFSKQEGQSKTSVKSEVEQVLNEKRKTLAFKKFLNDFQAAYNGYDSQGHIKVLLTYANERNPFVESLLDLQWIKLEEVYHVERQLGICTADEYIEELIAPIARAGIGALMMSGISREELKSLFDVLPYGKYST